MIYYNMSVDVQNSFKNQFGLIKTNDKNDGFYDNKYSYLNTPTTYNIEKVTVDSMFPFNTFDRMQKSTDVKKHDMSLRSRDNTLIIKDYYTQETGQYARSKKEINNLFEPMKNENALAGDTKLVDKIGLDRYSSSLKYKNGDLLDNTNIRPEWIDGVPTTYMIRPREKTQEELRGKGINSQRLAPENRMNETGQVGEGVSADPESINITKYKMKTYREQNSVDDLLRTTGALTKPEWRSLVRETSSQRSYMKNIDGPPMASVSRVEFRNEQSARPTQKEEETNYTGPSYGFVNNTEYRNYQALNPTQRMDYEGQLPITGTTSYVPREEFRNEQSLKPTIRMDYEGMLPLTGTTAFVSKETFRNEQSLNPTIRMEYEGMLPITGVHGFVDMNTYRNEQSAHPTLREDLYNNVSGTYNMSGGMVYENMQSLNPTQRIDYEETKYINGSFNQSNGQYRPYNDITRSGTVEEVLAKDYNGAGFAFVGQGETRAAAVNMVVNESIENSINLTNRPLGGGGTDRVPQGRENIGAYADRNRREKDGTINGMGRVRNVGVNYITEVPDTRGYNVLEQRQNDNMYLPSTLNSNPFVNNILYTGPSERDYIRETTVINTRMAERE